ncbi:dTDP-4-dehydrorhamnose 3,5-epimerase [Nocardioides sp. J9]|uniref:sugar nucleotide-binding protein n=1 Tax=Nocardioides sp. J9 TaxID=935844 RepID=UPI0011A3BD10|nr:bifunctional dTDP-4-dehydrorhamnose 3,5-epimerase family protein/NAD(P)-dependent oxidoreductase [Nocardioides sp. J9]TWG93950.1 dTDP-4-dehydrorhamnose 3,5-epimerase [Nocardioides sp. J9]
MTGVQTTPIPGLVVLDLAVHRDARGWFKENWHRERMVAQGLPDFGPVQNNISFNATRGVTRGVHAEPWDKLVSVASGRVFAAWVDLRAGDSFGATFWTEVDEGVAVFVPRGVGNSYQALEDGTVYSYLVNDHYVAGFSYPAVHLADETAGIPWPIPLDEAEVSDKDRVNPRLAEVTPMQPKRTLVTGCNGQLGRALAPLFPGATLVDLDELDITDPKALAAWPWQDYDLIVNAAAYTAVDRAETSEGRTAAWAANAAAPAALAAVAARHGITLVHYSTDYVFDGAAVEGGHREDEPFAPLGVYGQTKAAGDLAVGTAPKHYVLRTSWVIGDGHNFVRTMARLAADGVDPAVVDDQVGRLTFAAELARATHHLVTSGAPYGTYNVTNGGEPRSWADYARRVFELTGHDPARVSSVTTEEYGAGKDLAPRPLHSTLALDKIAATGFVSTDADTALTEYLSHLD